MKRSSYREHAKFPRRTNVKANEWHPWKGKHFVMLSYTEIEVRQRLRKTIKDEGVLDAHAEYMRRLPERSFA
jgi:hypothetical protein